MRMTQGGKFQHGFLSGEVYAAREVLQVILKRYTLAVENRKLHLPYEEPIRLTSFTAITKNLKNMKKKFNSDLERNKYINCIYIYWRFTAKLLVSSMVLLLCGSFSTNYLCYGQSFSRVIEKNDSVFKTEVKNFIDATKLKNKKVSDFFVYFLTVSITEDNSKIYMLSYMINSYDYHLIDWTYYCNFDNEIILINFKDQNIEHSIPKFIIIKKNDEIAETVKKKLLQESSGYIMSIIPSLILLDNGSNFLKRYYEDSDLLPDDLNIYDEFKNEVELLKIK